MAGFLLEDDAVSARKNVFDDWLEEQKRNAAAAAQQLQSTTQAATQAAADEVAQRRQQFDQWLASQQAQQPPPQPAQPTPPPAPEVLSAPAPVPMPTASAPVTPEAQQRASAFDDWINQRKQDVANVTSQLTAPALPHAEEPATATDTLSRAPGPTAADDLASRWKTQFDFGATYTGDYRTGTPHRGVDLVPSSGKGIGTEVDAFTPGKVTLIQRDSGAGGLMVYVQDDQGLTHAYMHLAGTQPGLKVGDQVQRGQPIAMMGESGTEGSPHLHYEVRKNAATGDPLNQLIDPRPYLQAGGAPQRTATVAQSDTPPPVQAIGKGKDAFVQTLAPLAQWFGDRTGIDPSVYLAIAANETGWGVSQTAQQQNNLFSIQGSGANGSRWAGYDSPAAAFQAFNDLISQAPRYAQAWADRHNPLKFINDLRSAGYVVDEPGYPAQGWVDQVGSIFNTLGSSVGTAAARAGNAVQDTGQQVTNLAQRAGGEALSSLGQGAQSVADRAQQLADQSTQLAQESARRAQEAQDLLTQTRQRATAENDRYFQQQDLRRQQQNQDLLQPRSFDLSMAQNQPVEPMRANQYGFTAPDLGGGFSALGSAANQAIQPGGPVGQYFDRLGSAGQSLAQHALANPLTPLITPGETGQELQRQFTTGVPARLMANDKELTDAAANAAIAKARDFGANPTPEQEQAVRTAFSAFAPSTLPLMFVGGEGAIIPRIGEGIGLTAASGAGMAAGEAVAPNLPEPLRPFAPLVGGFAAPVAASIGARALPSLARGGARAPVAGIVEGAGAPAPNTTRVYHGTSSDFPRPDPTRLSEESMYGPGYYLTDNPEVAGGRVAQGGEQVGPPGLVSPVKRPPGAVIQRGYAQEAMPPGFDERALAVDEERATNRLVAAQRDLGYARDNRNPIQETEAIRHIEAAQRDLDEIARDRAASFNEPAGPNVRPVDMPNDLKLLDAERYVPPEDLQAIRETIGEPSRQAVFDRQTARAFEGRPTGKQTYDALTAAYGRTGAAYTTANRVLAGAGFDGIRYPGGTIMPIVDAAGNAIRHNAYVIFPESLDKLTNAAAGTRGGILPQGAEAGIAPFARRAVGSAVGGVAGYATAPEGATPEERLQRAAVGAGAGLGLATGLESLGLAGRAGVRRALTAEELAPRGAERPNELVARLAAEAGTEEAAAEKVFSGPIADRLDQVAQQRVTPAEVEDARKALTQLAQRGDRITGVPAQFTTPEGLAQLRARLKVLAEEGASQKDWYSDSSHSILEATQGNKQDAEKLAQLVAIYSPNTPVNTNMNNALQAWHQWKAGEPIKVAMGAQDERASRLLYDGVSWEGRKTNNFYRNLMQHIDPEVYAQMGKETGQSGVTADIWMMRAFDYLAGPNQEGRRWIKAPSEAQYNFVQDEISRLGKELGWTPEQTQAAVWSSTKAAAEGTGITEAGFHYGTALEQRTAQVSYTASPGSTEAQRVPGYMDAPEHERAAYNIASESGFRDPVTGRDQAAEAAGLFRGRTLDVPEVYGNYVGPGLQAEVPVPAAKGSRTEKVLDEFGNQVRDAEGKLVTRSVPIREAAGLVFAPARDALNAFAAFRGKVLKQDAVPWTRMFFSNAPLRDSNLNQLHIGRPLTTDEAQQLNQALIAQLGGDGKHAVVATPDGAWILNLQGEFMRNPNAPNRIVAGERPVIDPETGKSMRDPENVRRVLKERTTREENVVGTWLPSLAEDGKPLPFADNPSFNKAVEEAIAEVNLSGDPDAHVSPFRSDGEYVFNDWEANPNGEGYQSQIESSGRAEAFAGVEAAITRRVRKAQADTAARFGWPADPNNPFSGAAEPGAVRERGLPGATGAEPAAGVGPRAPPEGEGFTAPTPAEGELPTTSGADIRGRLRDFLTGAESEAGSIDPRVGARIGGAVAGGIAGNASTPEDADPMSRYAHIGAGALAGAFAPGLLAAAVRNTGPSARELEALRPRAAVQGPPTTGTLASKVTEYGKGNLLSGITTHLSNIISQGVELARQPIIRTAAGYEDEAAHGIKSAASMMPTALERFGTALRTGRSIYADRPAVTNHPFLRLLSATDDFFRTLGESMGRGMEARRVLNEAGNPTNAAQIRSTIQGATDRIVTAGNKASNMTVFGEGANTGLGKWISDQKNQLLNSSSPKDKTLGLLFDATVPFSSIPDRLWTAGVMRSPGASEIGQLAKAGYHVAHGDARGARMALSEAAVGSVINATILSQLANGNVTGPDDPEHPNSIKLGGTWVDYSGWGPYALPIAIPAAIMESVNKTGNTPDAGTMQYAADISKAVTKTLLNQSYLGSFLRMAGQLGRGDVPAAVGQLGGGYVDRFVPASGLLNQVEQSFDQNLREIDAARPWEREASRIPGLSQFLPYKVAGTTGEPAVRPRGSVLGTLFRAETEETDPLKHELARLDRANFDVPLYKDYPDTVSWNGTEIKLRPDEQRKVTEQLGKARADLAKMVDSPAWRNMPAGVEGDRAKALILKRQLGQIDDLKTNAWLAIVNPQDAVDRYTKAQRVAGKLVGAR